MEVKYRSEEWEKTRSEIRNLIGLGAYGKGVIDELKDVTDNLEKVSDRISKYDSDGAISYSYSSDKDKYQRLFEDFKVLEEYSKKVGGIVEDTIDEPFHEDIDAFVHKMRDASISNFSTSNHIGAVDVQTVPYGQGTYSEVEVEKSEITIEDIFSGDTFYANDLKSQYEIWQAENPNEDITYDDFQVAAANTRAFEYESIEDGQFTVEFWATIAATVVIIGTSIVFPPAGLTLAAAYGTLEIASGATGKDWMTGRELGTGERWLRSALGPLDIIPGVATVKRFGGSAVRSASSLSNVNKLNTTNSSIAASISDSLSRQTANVKNVASSAGESVSRQVDNVKNLASSAAGNVKNLVSTANQAAVTRLNSARQVMDNKLSLAKQNVDNAVVNAAKKADDVATNFRAGLQPEHAVAGGGRVGPEPVTMFSDKAKEAGFVKSSVSDGVGGAGKGISKTDYKELRKKTPSKEIRKSVNPDGPKIDPVYSYEVNKFEADHIVSMKEITEMDGFKRLTKEQQIEVLNLKDNFIGLGKSTNASKGAHSWADWKGHSKFGEVPENIRMQMLELEDKARRALKIAIEERLNK